MTDPEYGSRARFYNVLKNTGVYSVDEILATIPPPRPSLWCRLRQEARSAFRRH